jgi:hypothetical protein
VHSLLDVKTKQLLERTLAAIDDGDTRGPRLLDDAERLRGRVRTFIRMKLLPGEMACFALQLP